MPNTDEIFDYVMDSPENTNPAVLRSMLNSVESGGGTTVVANPTLAGTEADLTGLQVGDIKYKVPAGGGGGSGGVLVVGATVDGSTVTMNKTWQEISNSDFPVLVGGGGGSMAWNPIMNASAGAFDNYYVDVLRVDLNTGTEEYEVQFDQFHCNSADGYPALNLGG